MKNYKKEDLRIMNSKMVKVNNQSYPQMKDGNYIYEIENEIIIEDKLIFINIMSDNLGTYMLNLILKWDKESDTLPKDKYNYPKTISITSWLNKNDTKRIISNHKGVYYYMFGQKHRGLSSTCNKTDYGYEMSYTGEHIINQWYHDLLNLLKKEEVKYFKTINSFEIKFNKLIEMSKGHTYFNCERLNGLLWNGNRQEYNITESDLDKWIEAYEKLNVYIKEISDSLE